MLLLTSTSDKVQLLTDAAVPVDVHASYMDTLGTVATPGRKNSKVNAVATTDIVAAPGSGIARSVKTLHIRNTHASTPVGVILRMTDGANPVGLVSRSLPAGWKLSYVEGEGIRIHDNNGILQ